MKLCFLSRLYPNAFLFSLKCSKLAEFKLLLTDRQMLYLYIAPRNWDNFFLNAFLPFLSNKSAKYDKSVKQNSKSRFKC